MDKNTRVLYQLNTRSMVTEQGTGAGQVGRTGGTAAARRARLYKPSSWERAALHNWTFRVMPVWAAVRGRRPFITGATMTYNLDSNHHELTAAAQKLGIIVIDNAKVKRSEPGQLDCWWGIKNHTNNTATWVWVEYKTEVGKLKPAQQEQIKACILSRLPVEIVRNTDDVIRVYKTYSGERENGK